MLMDEAREGATADRLTEIKTIGLIGGLSWESSAQYYRIFNEEVRRRRGGLHSARVLLLSVEFAEIARLQHDDDWGALTRVMVDAARSLERGGADLLLIGANTMHKVAAAMEEAVSIPLLHIVDPTAAAIKAAGHRKVGLLGTTFTMEHGFFKDRARDRFGLDIIVPDETDRRVAHTIIYKELAAGQVLDASRGIYRGIIARLVERGAEAIILGCTELMLLVRDEDSVVPLFDTTKAHAMAAVDYALSTEAIVASGR